MTSALTAVEIAFFPEHLNWWLRFGAPDVRIDLDRRRALALFEPVRMFGYVRWSANAYGTQNWSLVVVLTRAPGAKASRLAGVRPGGEPLLSASGTASVKRALAALDRLEADGFALSEIAPAYLRHIHNRLIVKRPVRAYSQAGHAAHLAAKAVTG